jgi:predicted GNAT family N-acyltransferase
VIFLKGLFMNILAFDFLPKEAMDIRIKVFCDEQGFVDEMDDIDSFSTHFLVFDNDKAVATCRLFEQNGKHILGRFAVLKDYRNKGVGRLLMSFVEDTLLSVGYNELYLHSQLRAKKFYEKCGFVSFGEIDCEENCPHIWMKKSLN